MAKNAKATKARMARPPGTELAKPTGFGEIARMKVADLRFDTENPRITELLGANPTQPQIQAVLAGDMRAKDLIPSFMENGFIPYEPLIVRKKAGNFVVVEGNRRLAALREMIASDDAGEKAAVELHGLHEAPCVQFTGDERQLLAYLGLRHLSKTKDWTSNAKAGFVERILKAGHDLKAAARLTNTTTSSLRLMLLTRRLFDRATGSLGLDLQGGGAAGDTVFWHLGDSIRRTKTKNYLELVEDPNPLSDPELNESKFERLVGWLYGNSKTRAPKIIDSIRDIGRLDDCLGNPKATEALENGRSLEEALEELQVAGTTISAHLGRAKKSLERANGGPWGELNAEGHQQVVEGAKAVRIALSQIEATLEFHAKRLKGN